MTAALVAEATGGRLTAGAPGTAFSAVSIDSRTVPPGALFVAIRGERFDGHDYVAQAIARGAAGVLVSHAVAAAGAAVVLVPDTLTGLQALAREIRRRSGATVVAITGSAGKTSTKEITADLLETQYRVFRNRGNLNNHIGLPLSLTELASGPDMAVVELGMNHAGEIRALVGMALPDVRVWTNVGDAHIGYFGSRDAVARAKAEILEGAGPSTLLVLNADDPLVMSHAPRTGGRVLTFGVSPAAMVRATDVLDRGFDGTAATVITPRGPVEVSVGLPGRAQLMNVLAAIAVATEYGVALHRIPAVVGAARPVARRGSIALTPAGARIVDDSYNASPAAVMTALEALKATPGAARRIAALGEMRELGDQAFDLHDACGRAAAAAGVDLLVAVGGPAADGFVAGATAAGMAASRVLRFEDARAACAPVAALIRRGDLVLVKGSRGTRMDILADALAAEGQG